jgi:hypothetical protein
MQALVPHRSHCPPPTTEEMEERMDTHPHHAGKVNTHRWLRFIPIPSCHHRSPHQQPPRIGGQHHPNQLSLSQSLGSDPYVPCHVIMSNVRGDWCCCCWSGFFLDGMFALRVNSDWLEAQVDSLHTHVLLHLVLTVAPGISWYMHDVAALKAPSNLFERADPNNPEWLQRYACICSPTQG